MNEDLNAQRPSAEERVASFARAANILAAFARAGARLRPAAAIRARADALAGALRALEVPARAVPNRGSVIVTDAQARDLSASQPTARPLAAVLAARNVRPAPIAARLADRSRTEGIAPSSGISERGNSSPRAAITRALAATRAGSAALGRAQQMTLRANLQSGAQDSGTTSAAGSIAETGNSHAASHVRDPNIATILTAASARRRTIAGARRARSLAIAPEAEAGAAGFRPASPPPQAVTAIAALPARIQRMLARSRTAAPSVDEPSLRADSADSSRERKRDIGARGGRRRTRAAAAITINSSPSITVNLPPGAAEAGERGISRAVAQALEEHAERLYEMMRQVGAFRERTEF
jgi:hypothetical protein